MQDGAIFTMKTVLNFLQHLLRYTESLKKGHFVLTCASAVRMDQTLEMVYNKLAKGQGGITGFTRRREVVLQFNLIRYEKVKI